MDSSARSKSPPLSKVTQSKVTPSPLLSSRSKGGSSSFFDESSTKRAGGGGGGRGGGLDIDLDDSETAAFHNDSTVQSYSHSNRLGGMIYQHSSSSNSVKDRVALINSALNVGEVPTLSIIKSSKKSSKGRDPDQQTATQRSDQYSIGIPVLSSPPQSPSSAADWQQHLIDYRTGSSKNIINNIITAEQQQPSQEQREESKYRKKADETPEEREARRQLRREHRSKQQQNELSKQQQNDCVLSRMGYLEHELDLHVDHRLKKSSYETREEREEARRLRKKEKEGEGGGGGSSQKLKSKSTDAYCTMHRASSSSSRGGQGRQLLDDADTAVESGRDYKAALQFWQQPHLKTHNDSPPGAADPSMMMRRSRSARNHSSPSLLRRTQGDESYLPTLEGRSSSPVVLPQLMGDRTRSNDKPARSSSRRHRDNSTAATSHHSPSNNHHHHYHQHQQPIALQSPSTNSEALVSVAATHEPYLEALLPASPLEGTGGLFEWPRTLTGGGGGWRCVFCTFVNPTDFVCCGACQNYPPP